MAALVEGAAKSAHVERKNQKKPVKRYWEKTEELKNSDQPTSDRSISTENTADRCTSTENTADGSTSTENTGSVKRRKGGQIPSGKKDPFPGEAPIPQEQLQKYQRGSKNNVPKGAQRRLKEAIAWSETVSELAQKQAARYDLLLPEDAGFLEGDEDEDTCRISQEDIADAVDITSGSKYFNLHLSQFGPYRLDYSRTGRHLLLSGKRGHVACIEWQSKNLTCEMNVMETVNDIKWLHTEAMFAVAQKKWLYIYDSEGIELHCVKKFNDVLKMQFLPYHFLLATASATGFLQYLDVSVGKEIAAICTKSGRLDVMSQNPYNAVIHLGHSNGTVSLWSPNQKEPLVKMLCHRGAIRSLTVDKTGTYMVTSGLDRKLKVYDVRAFKPLHSYFLPAGASCLSLSQKGLLSAATGDIVQVYQNVWGGSPVSKPYMAHRVRGQVWGLAYCPFEDVLGVGHGEGFTSMIVPGAGEPNFDALDTNPYRSAKQRQEWEVKALLEKVQPELIGLDPGQLGKVDQASFEQRHKERVDILGYDPLAKEKFKPKAKKKGRSSAGAIEKRKRKVAYEDQRDVIRQNVEEQMKRQKEKSSESQQLGKKSTLDRFRKQDK
ncbi:WD repeat-containing protein 46 [Triplophysa rosa]|uniref:WD repeat-containing protein 46 n=1 Tax=Triplophysa rosa TaxID=992332 RepID=A0A9W7WI15_TRIRA|nr:WD repeat-containing protein 46 [Triplophysa rosa]KAI7798228.1 BING4-like [Triplophysa rosa]